MSHIGHEQSRLMKDSEEGSDHVTGTSAIGPTERVKRGMNCLRIGPDKRFTRIINRPKLP
jgi:hypothetical protein